VVIDQKSNSNLLFLPLDKLMQAAASGVEPATRGSLPEALTSPPSNGGDVPGRTRDAFRSRDRESR
jgi:membrane protease subunit HflK